MIDTSYMVVLNLFLYVNRCAGAGHLRDDILYYSKELEKHASSNCEDRTHLMDMGVKALRLVWCIVEIKFPC